MLNLHARQRVWRACQECRRKKVKCDGEQPCRSCRRNRLECAYADPAGNMRMADPEYVMRLESRLQWMEAKLHGQDTGEAGQDPGLFANGQPIDTAESEVYTSLGTRGDEPLAFTSPNIAVSDPTAAHDLPLELSGSSGKEQATRTTDRLEIPIYDVNELENHASASEPAAEAETHPPPVDVSLLPNELLQVLIDQFYTHIYPMFPIFREGDLRKHLNEREHDDAFLLLLHALLAVSATILPPDHRVFDKPIVRPYEAVDLGALLYSHGLKTFSPPPDQGDEMSSFKLVIAQGLLSLYLAEAGRANEAWVTAGHAIRLYQGLDLGQLTDGAEGPDETRSTQGNLWRCLYILDRSLSTVLSRPMAIDDADCDMNLSDDDDGSETTTGEEVDPWFSVIADFHITMGKIYKSVRSIRKSSSNSSPAIKETLRSRVRQHDLELETYYNKQVLTKMGDPTPNSHSAPLQLIAVASYHTGVVLLYRTFIETFTTADMGPESFLRCAEAASNCISLTPQFVSVVPASHFLLQQSRAIYASAKVLLQCMRLSRNMAFAAKSWNDVETAVKMLRGMKIQWPEIKKYQLLTEEDMRATQVDLERHDLFHKTFDRYGLAPSMLSDGLAVSNFAVRGPQQTRLAGHQFPEAVSQSSRSPMPRLLSSRRDHTNGRQEDAPSKRRKTTTIQFMPICSADVAPLVEDGTHADFADQSQQFMDFLLDLPPLTPGGGLSPTHFGEDAISMSPMEQFALPPEQ